MPLALSGIRIVTSSEEVVSAVSYRDMTTSSSSGDETGISSIIHHPMEPGQAGTGGFYINHVAFYYRGEKFVTFETGDALSNDPYLGLSFKEDGAPGTAKAIWRDTKGYSYEGEK